MSRGGVAVVVGATGSIGRAICARLHAEGYPLVAVARSGEPLNSWRLSCRAPRPRRRS